MKDFDRFFQKIYEQPLENRKDWYAASTVDYAKYRAPYVPKVIDQVCAEFPETKNLKLLEVGSGPGNASQHFVQRGYNLTCVEPNTTACLFAKERFQDFPNVNINNSTFEEWSDNNQQKFDGAIASTSFHWLDAETRCARLANLLNPEGKIVLLWCTAPQPEKEVYQYLDPIYQEYMPSFADYENFETQRQNINRIAQELVTSGYFTHLKHFEAVGDRHYQPEEYLSLLTTLSPYIALPKERRITFFKKIRKTFESNNIRECQTKYICAAHTATKISA
ncbi:class I SAM-dependent methyltransferase [[Limnothrix rosea] IAM M-220]|uniref:class I SAM-dependent methyltransferase n=1 Tax=[Limnothrix rosea] IAM M-220 TaxID=454133 RepID=UPI00096326FB|nr:class I SAM-dependent methyltransferase [[Limnothrix rosea] IAM M-220]OKH14172.1 SAM-dependent methyltransferase [[Limnothrix rosea] IAM M-220]